MDVLMARAGRAVAEEALKRHDGRPIHVLCGPGNNGGDGFVAARELVTRGCEVHVHAGPVAGGISDEARAAREAWQGGIAPLEAALELPRDVFVVDALFGAGLARPLEGIYAALAEGLGQHAVLAVDMPSGVPGDTGRPEGAHVTAAATVTFAAMKPGHLLMPGRGLCGETVVRDIGIGADILAQVSGPVFENRPALWQSAFPWPGPETHKHRRGRLGVVSGTASATGAARLAARAGLRIGAGLVTLRCPPSATLVLSIASEAVMVRAFDGVEAFAQTSGDDHALVIGPANGVNDETKARVLSCLETGKPVVLDADALTVFAGGPDEFCNRLHDRAVLTPHAGEFARIFADVAGDAASPLDAACAAAARSGAVILLKGPSTCIAAPDGRAAINAHATPWLATAGAGDVLAGLIGGLLAQGMDPFAAACAATWLHGDAGLRFGPGLIAEDLPEQVPACLAALRAGQDHRQA